jgi:pSer/pThr/pTyr-binding forkhead associated (FHA) protein
MDARLVVVGGDSKATEIKLRLPATLGRGRDATLTVPHPLVSRQHCEIFEKDGFLVVRDLGSLNGTFIGDERITEAVLHDGELLTIGTVTFRAVYTDDPDLSAPVREEPSPTVASDGQASLEETLASAGQAGSEQAMTEPQTPPDSNGPGEDGADEQFAALLNSVDVEGDQEEPGLIGAEATIESAAPDFAERVEEAEEVAEPAEIGDVAQPEEVEYIEEVEEVEQVEELQQVDGPTAQKPAPVERQAPPPRPAATQKTRVQEPVSSDEMPSSEEDDELQAFLKELDI